MLRILLPLTFLFLVGCSSEPSGETSSSTEAAAIAMPKEAKVCLPCHLFEEEDKKKVGPPLWNIYNKWVNVEGLSFTKWTEENLDVWLEDPKRIKPLTKMYFPGIKDPAERKIVIEYLKKLSERASS